VQRVATSAGLPRWIYIPAAMGALFVVVPLIAVAAKVDLPHFWSLITSESSTTALMLSLETSAAARHCVCCSCVPMALVLARSESRPVAACQAAHPASAGIATGGGRNRNRAACMRSVGFGLIGGSTSAPRASRSRSTTTAVVLAQTFVSLPFLVIALEGAARTAGADYEVVAATLGARPTTVWWRVSLPLLAPGLISGAVLAFARSLGEFGATLTFAGSRQGVTRTLPLEIYLQRESDPDAAVALSLLLVAVAAVVVVALGSRQIRAPMPGSRS